MNTVCRKMCHSPKHLNALKYLVERINRRRFNKQFETLILKPFNIETVESERYNLSTFSSYSENSNKNDQMIKTLGLSMGKNDKRYKENYSLLRSNGFTESEAENLLHSVPDILEMNEEKLMASLINWRTLKMKESDMLNALYSVPELILLKPKYVNERITQLLTVFTNADIIRLFKISPVVFIEEWDDLIKKMQYMVYEMGSEQPNIIKARALMFDLETIQIRHQFLHRSGKYKKPKAKKPNRNPPMYKIFEPKLTDFLKLSGLSEEEYTVFSDVYINELVKEMNEDEQSEDEDT